MIISASRRTDIPALYARWFANRLRAGACLVPNPMNPKQVARVSLRPEEVSAFVFWTRHARPFFAVVAELERIGLPFYFQYTITGYGRALEARVPPLEVALRTALDLAERCRPGALVWRYDPIIIGPAVPFALHRERFAAIARRLEGKVSRVVVSLLDLYRKTERRLRPSHPVGTAILRDAEGLAETDVLLAELAAVARQHGMTIAACAEGRDSAHLGIERARCVDPDLLRQLYGEREEWAGARKDPGQRAACRCVASKDIGVPATCTFGCRYCYATISDEVARRRWREHDPEGEMLWERP